MTCRYVLRLFRLATYHVQHNEVLSVPVLSAHARWCLAHMDECAHDAKLPDVQFVEILAKGDVRGAYTFYAGWPRTPAEDDLGPGYRGVCDDDGFDGPAD